MNYREFVNCIEKGIRGFLPEELQNVSIEATEVEKLQGGSYYGLRIIPENRKIGMCINLEDTYKRVLAGMSFEEVMSEICNILVDDIDSHREFETYDFGNYEVMKKHLMIQVVNTADNASRLASIPHREVEDLSIIYRFILDAGIDTEASVLLTNDLIANYNITEEQLYNDAMANSPVRFPATFGSIGSVLAGLTGCDPDFFEGDHVPLFVLSCNQGVNGAGAVFYPGLLAEISAELGKDFYILPSSVHEVLILPDTGDIDVEHTKELVASINQAELPIADKLSDNVYHYEASAGIFEAADKYLARKAYIS